MTKFYSVGLLQKYINLSLLITLSYSFQVVYSQSDLQPDSIPASQKDSIPEVQIKLPILNISDDDDQDGGGQDIAGLLQLPDFLLGLHVTELGVMTPSTQPCSSTEFR
jgi:hypothetical protein